MISFTSNSSFSTFINLSASCGSYHFFRKSAMFGYGNLPPVMSTTASWYTDGSAAKYSRKSNNKLLRRMNAALSGYSISVIAVAEMPSAVVQQWHLPASCSRVTVHFEPGLVRLIKNIWSITWYNRKLNSKSLLFLNKRQIDDCLIWRSKMNYSFFSKYGNIFLLLLTQL